MTMNKIRRDGLNAANYAADSDCWQQISARRARRVFAGLYLLAVLCLLWCALPLPSMFSTLSLLPAIVAAQVLGAIALLGWLLAWPVATGTEAGGVAP
jgi:hypothetical protein